MSGFDGNLGAFEKGSTLVRNEQSPLTPNGSREKIQLLGCGFLYGNHWGRGSSSLGLSDPFSFCADEKAGLLSPRRRVRGVRFCYVDEPPWASRDTKF
ncbi:hypothetical protein Bcep1808_0161 [Burkholderia vietnamiensis G4]|uniref:Uncharacterized protein n=1 Tax=Burkholderia vietnamiensis (strain G4 / LMG 22486) TaxID=269482 RepID=A4JA81_BURVG|nr:hypothetical protein Bcep1808_0161 [Burkholderia vietnamiensis G4]